MSRCPGWRVLVLVIATGTPAGPQGGDDDPSLGAVRAWMRRRADSVELPPFAHYLRKQILETARNDVFVVKSDYVAAVLVLSLSVVAVLVGVHAGHKVMDVDEIVYERVLRAMHSGAGYYDSMRHALILKEGAPATQLRSFRPPTLFLLLARLPPSSWRWIVGIVYVAVLTTAWRLGRSPYPVGGPIAVVLTATWVIAAAPLLYLHAELWGLPFALAGILAAKRDRWGSAAILIGAAVVFRELYGVLFVFGFLLAPKRKPWVIVGLGLTALGTIHWVLVSAVLSDHGREAPFGKGIPSLSHALSSIGPSDSVLGYVLGIVTLVGGMSGLIWQARKPTGAAARIALAFVVVMIPVTVEFGRVYWALCFGPVLACNVPMAKPFRSRWHAHEEPASVRAPPSPSTVKGA